MEELADLMIDEGWSADEIAGLRFADNRKFGHMIPEKSYNNVRNNVLKNKKRNS